MNTVIQYPENLEYTQLTPDSRVATIQNDICDMKVYHFSEGYVAPRHTHSGPNFKFLLKGEILVNGAKEVGTGALYACGSIYYFTVPKEAYLLVVQTPGTERILAE